MKINELIGKVVKTDIGNLRVKAANYSGLKTGAGGKIIKFVTVKTECGSEFTSTMADLEAVAV